MAILRIAAAAALLCWVAPDVPRALIGIAPAGRAEALKAAGGVAGEVATQAITQAATHAAERFCGDQPERCIALAASAVALAKPTPDGKPRRPNLPLARRAAPD